MKLAAILVLVASSTLGQAVPWQGHNQQFWQCWSNNQPAVELVPKQVVHFNAFRHTTNPPQILNTTVTLSCTNYCTNAEFAYQAHDLPLGDWHDVFVSEPTNVGLITATVPNKWGAGEVFRALNR